MKNYGQKYRIDWALPRRVETLIMVYGKSIFGEFLPVRRYASAGLCDSDVSVCPSVCHTPVLCLAERKQDREMYTV